VPKPTSDPSIADLAEQAARRKAPSSPRQKHRARRMRLLATSGVVLLASVLVFVWLLLP